MYFLCCVLLYSSLLYFDVFATLVQSPTLVPTSYPGAVLQRDIYSCVSAINVKFTAECRLKCKHFRQCRMRVLPVFVEGLQINQCPIYPARQSFNFYRYWVRVYNVLRAIGFKGKYKEGLNFEVLKRCLIVFPSVAAQFS